MVAITKTQAEILSEGLHTSSRLTALFYRMYRKGAQVYLPEDIIPHFNQAKVKFIVMGTHGVGAWRSEPRATQDVDFLIAKKDHAKATRIVKEMYPELEMIDGKVVTRFKDKTLEKVVIDLMKPDQPLFKLAFKNTVEVEDYLAPNLEMALASKFAAMVSHNRVLEKKYIDAGDFIDMVKTNRNEIDLKKLVGFCEKVYPGGGTEVSKMLEDIFAGRKIQF